MSTLDELLGLDPDSGDALRAELLATNDRALLRDLVRIRHERGLTQAEVGKLLGISQPSVAEFEAYDSNPTLATIRRYAHAVRALIKHQVERDEGQLLDDRRDEWVPTSIQKKPVKKLKLENWGFRGRFSGDFPDPQGVSGQRDFALAS